MIGRAEGAGPSIGWLKELGWGMGALTLVVYWLAPRLAALFEDQRSRAAAAQVSLEERLAREEAETKRLRERELELVQELAARSAALLAAERGLEEGAQERARLLAEAAVAAADLGRVTEERDRVLAEAAAEREAKIEAQAAAARLRAQLDSRT